MHGQCQPPLQLPPPPQLPPLRMDTPFSKFSSAMLLKQRKRSEFNRARRILHLATPITAVLAQTSLLLSLCTADWVRTEENMPNRNRTVLFGPDKSPEYLPKLVYGGLFQLCYTKPGGTEYSCVEIDYFPSEDYLPDQHDSTMAIAYVVIHSAYFFFVALLLISLAQVLSCVGLCGPGRKRFMAFFAGIVFIISGLLLFVGQVFFISLLKGEVETKLTPASLLSPPRLTCGYGWSFLLLIVAFLSCMAAGTADIFIFSYHCQHQRFFRVGGGGGRKEEKEENNGGGGAVVGLRLGQEEETSASNKVSNGRPPTLANISEESIREVWLRPEPFAEVTVNVCPKHHSSGNRTWTTSTTTTTDSNQTRTIKKKMRKKRKKEEEAKVVVVMPSWSQNDDHPLFVTPKNGKTVDLEQWQKDYRTADYCKLQQQEPMLTSSSGLSMPQQQQECKCIYCGLSFYHDEFGGCSREEDDLEGQCPELPPWVYHDDVINGLN